MILAPFSLDMSSQFSLLYKLVNFFFEPPTVVSCMTLNPMIFSPRFKIVAHAITTRFLRFWDELGLVDLSVDSFWSCVQRCNVVHAIDPSLLSFKGTFVSGWGWIIVSFISH